MNKLLSKYREKRAKGDEGFTLIELLVVVVIIGVLIAIAIPLYLNYRKGANDAAAESDMHNAVNTLEQCYTENGHYPRNDFDFGQQDRGDTRNADDCGNNQKINLSTGTTFQYRHGSNPVNGGSYTIIALNANGSGKTYCYNSTKGGQVVATNNPLQNVTQGDINYC
jgi:type IV pilus assembly protein PilA